MFSNAFQSGFVSIFYSIGSNPLSLWDKAVKNGHVRRVIDEEVKSLVLEVSGTNVATTYITCPIKPKAALGIRLPFLVMIVKNLKKYFTFEIQILDDKDMRRRFRVSNFQSTTKVRPFCTTMLIGLSPGWNQIQFNLADFTRRAYGTKNSPFILILLLLIYFSDRLYTEEELPTEYRLFLPLRSEKPTKAATKRSKEKVPQKAPPIKAEEEEKKIETVEEEIPSGAPPTPADALTEAQPVEEPPPDEPVSEKATIGKTQRGEYWDETMESIIENNQTTYIKTIEWEMMDKTKFFPLSMLSSFSVRCALYPLTLIKTRLQIQKHNNMYSGIYDAYCKILKLEGVGGLYKGFWISSVQILSGVFYVSTYEGVRYTLASKNVSDSKVRALIAGGSASIVGQTIIVPFDVLSQHLMMMGVTSKDSKNFNPLGIREDLSKRGKFALTAEIVRKIMKSDGLPGFYRGYTASLCAYVPNSALWWAFYHLYQDEMYKIVPVWVSHLLIQTIAGTLGGFTTTIITNPLDVVRARLQVQRISSMRLAFMNLWQEEGFRMFSKGLSARLIQSATFSFSIILGYETIKRVSVNDEYKEFVKW